MAQKSVNQYQFLGRLGEGGMGTVYKARDTVLGRLVALKFLPAQSPVSEVQRKRFEREARAASVLDHPNVCRVYEFGETAHGELFIAMALVEGESLAASLKRGPLPLASALDVARQVAAGLGAAHERGIVHRDVKPGNVILTPEGVAKLIDFGVARTAGSELTETGATVGTAAYMAPEQALGRPADGRADLWGLGVMLYEMLTGERPFGSDYWMAVMYAIIHMDPTRPIELNPELPEAVDALIWKLLAKEPADRYATAADVEAALAEIVAEPAALRSTPAPPTGASDPPTTPTTPTVVPGERRQVTVLTGAMQLVPTGARAFDPEDLLAVTPAYDELCRRIIARFDGYAESAMQYNALVVYYGFPRAHEDDPQRAVETGLELLRATEELNPALESRYGARMQVRLGVHTGWVVVQDRGAGTQTRFSVTGAPSAIARQIHQSGPAGRVLVTEATRRFLKEAFVVVEQPEARGSGDAAKVYVVEKKAETADVWMGDRAGARRPLVGREQEAEVLADRWARTREGMGQGVWISGEAGIGKSRLVEELLDAAHRTNPALVLRSRCSPYFRNSVLYPFLEMLEQEVLQSTSDVSPQARLEELEAVIEEAGLDPAESAPLLGSLLALPVEGRYGRPPMPPELQKQFALQTLLTLVVSAASEQPTLLLVEDLHWADPTSVDLLGAVMEHAAAIPLCVVVTYRPEFAPPWPPRSHVTQITINRLSGPQAEALIDALAVGRKLPRPAVRQILDKADGVPIFIEELTRTLLASDALHLDDGRYVLRGAPSDLAVPDTLRGSLMARLDRTPSARVVAQVASAIGREFSFDVLRAVAPLDEPGLRREVDRLVANEVLYRRGVGRRAGYVFKHALIQEAAYESMLKANRREVHLALAHWLEANDPDRIETQPELVARHYTEAGAPEPALQYWQRAAERAMGHAALHEAGAHLREVLDLLDELPESPEAQGRELGTRLMYGGVLFATQGPGAPAVRANFERAHELCDVVGGPAERAQTLFGLWSNHFFRAELIAARDLADAYFDLVRESGDVLAVTQGHFMVGNSAYMLGDFEACATHAGQVLDLYEPAHHEPHLMRFGQNPRITAWACGACALWMLGRPDAALEHARATWTEAQALGHPFIQAIGLHIVPWIHLLRGERAETRTQAEALIALSEEHGFPVYLLMGHVMLGWALAADGEVEAGFGHLQQGIGMTRAFGIELTRPFYLGLLADAFLRAGAVADGLAAVDEALELVEKNEDRFYEAELRRLRGELLALDDPGAHRTEIEAAFAASTAVARAQQARALELRTALSLARLHADGPNADAARQALADLVAAFDEGRDTADLQAAATLLETA